MLVSMALVFLRAIIYQETVKSKDKNKAISGKSHQVPDIVALSMADFEQRLDECFKDGRSLILETLQMESYIFSHHEEPVDAKGTWAPVIQNDNSKGDWDLPFRQFSVLGPAGKDLNEVDQRKQLYGIQ